MLFQLYIAILDHRRQNPLLRRRRSFNLKRCKQEGLWVQPQLPSLPSSSVTCASQKPRLTQEYQSQDQSVQATVPTRSLRESQKNWMASLMCKVQALNRSGERIQILRLAPLPQMSPRALLLRTLVSGFAEASKHDIIRRAYA